MADQVSYPEFLRLLADFIEEHPTLPQPTMYELEKGATFYLNRDTAKDQLRSIGEFKKTYTNDRFHATKELGGRPLTFNASRDAVCERVVTGTRIVPEQYIPNSKFVPQHVEEIVEWRCDDPVLATESKEE